MQRLGPHHASPQQWPYTGLTSVDGGTLIAANASASATGTSPVIVKGGATLAGGDPNGTTGLIAGPVSIADGGAIAPVCRSARPGR